MGTEEDGRMTTLTITLPAEIKDFVEEQAVRGGSTVSEYLGDILREMHNRQRERREIREKLLEAVHSGPATPMTRQDWDDIRREVRDSLEAEGRGRDAEPAR